MNECDKSADQNDFDRVAGIVEHWSRSGDDGLSHDEITMIMWAASRWIVLVSSGVTSL